MEIDRYNSYLSEVHRLEEANRYVATENFNDYCDRLIRTREQVNDSLRTIKSLQSQIDIIVSKFSE